MPSVTARPGDGRSVRNVRMDASPARRLSQAHSTPPSAVPASAAEVAGHAQPDRGSPGDALTRPAPAGLMIEGGK